MNSSPTNTHNEYEIHSRINEIFQELQSAVIEVAAATNAGDPDAFVAYQVATQQRLAEMEQLIHQLSSTSS